MNSSMITKFHELVGQVQFVVFEKFTSEKLLLLFNGIHEKASQKI